MRKHHKSRQEGWRHIRETAKNNSLRSAQSCIFASIFQPQKILNILSSKHISLTLRVNKMLMLEIFVELKVC
jgi:hypothetical protein